MENIENNLETLVSAEELKVINRRLAAEIDRDYRDSKNLVLLCILKGSMIFLSDLCREMKSVCEMEFMKVVSYGTGVRKSSGEVHILLDILRKDIADCDILVVEDIIDSGRTLSYLTKHLLERGARSVRTCTLLDKPSRREVPFTPDYVGVEIPDRFVLGYGLDYDEKYRNIPYVAAVRQ